ncbi:MAG: protein kinase domain-containing protein [Myxococcota bacterium]
MSEPLQPHLPSRLDSFEVLEEIGRGGMGAAWRARHRNTGDDVVIKTVMSAQHPGRRAMFVREARSMAVMEHEGIIRILDFGQAGANHDRFDEGALYIVMELAEGGSLHNSDIDDWQSLLQLTLQVLDALAHAHARDLVHLDLKPENILVARTRTGRPSYRLADFGISRSLTDITETSQLSGTPHYMAPEQGLGRASSLGPWTDLYALGCLIWELATGRPPFSGGNAIEIINAHVHASLPAFSPRFDVPEGLETWLRRLLEKSPIRRYRRAADAAWSFGLLGPPTRPSDDDAFSEADDVADSDRTEDYADTVLESVPRGMLTTLDVMNTTATRSPEVVDSDPSWLTTPRRPVTRPPLTDRWVPQSRRSDTTPIPDAGLGLFGLRPPPFVGRKHQLDTLWRQFQGVIEGGPRHLVICGESGVGKTRLTRTLSRRLRGLGQATELFVDLEQLPWREAVPHALRRYFQLGGPAPPDNFDEQVQLIAPGADPAAVRRVLSDDEESLDLIELFADLSTILAGIAENRPVVVIQDDVRFDTLGFDFAEYVARSAPEASILLLSTISEDASTPVATRVHAHGDRRRTIDRLTRSETGELVDRLLPLAPDTRRALLEQTNYDPLFAHQIVASWLETGALESSADGYRGPDEFPNSQNQLWFQRLSRIATAYGISPDALFEPMAVAAMLGSTVRKAIWRAVCAAVGLDVDEGILLWLTRRGHLLDTDDAIVFRDATLRRALLSRLDDDTWIRAVNLAAAEALASLSDRTAMLRRARHLQRAGELALALEQLRTAAYRSSPSDAQAIAHLREMWLARSSDPALYEERVMSKVEIAMEAIQNCHFDRADATIAELEALIDDETDPVLVAERHLAVASRALFAHRPEDAVETAEEAVGLAEQYGTMADIHACRSTAGDIFMYGLEFVRSRDHLMRAQDAAEHSHMRAWSQYRLAMLDIVTGDVDNGIARLESPSAYFREHQDPYGTILTRELLALAAFEKGEFDRAISLLEQALAQSKVIRYAGQTVMHERLGRVHARTGASKRALEHLQKVQDVAEEQGYSLMTWYSFGARAEAHARAGRWGEVEAVMEQACQSEARPGLFAETIAQAWEAVAYLAEGSGRSDIETEALAEADAVRRAPHTPPNAR